MALMKTIITNFSTIAGPLVMLLYPLYASIKAIESSSNVDDQQWLTYWVLYSFISLLELSLWRLFAWLPLWRTIKLLGACWLVFPQFNGAAFVYEYFVRKKLFRYQDDPNLTHSQPRILRMMSPRARESVEVYIDSYGQNAFEKVIAAATKEARKYTPSPTN